MYVVTVSRSCVCEVYGRPCGVLSWGQRLLCTSLGGGNTVPYNTLSFPKCHCLPPLGIMVVGCIGQPAMRRAGLSRSVLAIIPTPFPSR